MALARLARLDLDAGRLEAARGYVDQATTRLEAGPREVREGLVEVWHTRSRVLIAAGQRVQAADVLQRAVDEFARQSEGLEGETRAAFFAVPLHREIVADAERILGRAPRVVPGRGAADSEDQARELREALQAARAVARAPGLAGVVEQVLDAALRSSGFDRAWLLVAERDRLAPLGGRRAGRIPLEPASASPDAALVEAGARLGRLVTEHDVSPVSAHVSETFQRALAPLRFGDGERLVGALYLEADSPRSMADGLDEHRRLILEALADLAAFGVQHHLQLEENEQLRRRAEANLTRTRARLAEEAARREQAERVAEAERRVSRLRYSYDQIIHRSGRMRDVLAQVDRVVDRKITVLVAGGSGTGKELVARALHYNGPRSAGPFVPINCGAIPANLIESELFGHVRGAFTGAVKDRRGHFELAHRGTLFLDEIGDITPEVQVRLLRVLETGEVTPVGSSRRVAVDVRIVCASNRDLAREVAAGRFREDLLYRINTIQIALPPLRDRMEDLPLLVEHFGALVARERGEPVVRFGPEILRRLAAHTWPGNIRELRNVVEYATLFAEDGEVPPGLSLPF